MIKEISIIQYRKLKNISLKLEKGINAISGTNGTCKTSLLHIISNSFQALAQKKIDIHNLNSNDAELAKQYNECISIISSINKLMNPKIESLTKGDKTYNDPAVGISGELYTVTYNDGISLSFRRHNSLAKHQATKRYALKPKYSQNKSESLPMIPVIYLGLTRLIPIGEIIDNDSLVKAINRKLPDEYHHEIEKICKKYSSASIKKINQDLPEKYNKDINEIYNNLTGIMITDSTRESFGDLKHRANFTSSQKGVDSNTISAGEDNLYIILSALVSLKYFYECPTNISNITSSLFLIDEIDATLHPSLQEKLLNLFREYSENYNIQIIFTTHSISLLENCLDKKNNVIYLLDQVDTVETMKSPDIFKIKMHLQELTRSSIYKRKAIPIFTEDEEARLLLDKIFDYFEEKYPHFTKIRARFHIVKCNMGCNVIKSMFEDTYLHQVSNQSIAILDGDQTSIKKGLTKNILVLPGKKSPEQFIFDYAEEEFQKKSNSFWTDQDVIDCGYSKKYYQQNIKPEIDNIDIELSKDTNKKRRELTKKIFNNEDYKDCFEMLFAHWVHNPENQVVMNSFYNDLKVLFIKTAPYQGINPRDWEEKKSGQNDDFSI